MIQRMSQFAFRLSASLRLRRHPPSRARPLGAASLPALRPAEAPAGAATCRPPTGGNAGHLLARRDVLEHRGFRRHLGAVAELEVSGNPRLSGHDHVVARARSLPRSPTCAHDQTALAEARHCVRPAPGCRSWFPARSASRRAWRGRSWCWRRSRPLLRPPPARPAAPCRARRDEWRSRSRRCPARRRQWIDATRRRSRCRRRARRADEHGAVGAHRAAAADDRQRVHHRPLAEPGSGADHRQRADRGRRGRSRRSSSDHRRRVHPGRRPRLRMERARSTRPGRSYGSGAPGRSRPEMLLAAARRAAPPRRSPSACARYRGLVRNERSPGPASASVAMPSTDALGVAQDPPADPLGQLAEPVSSRLTSWAPAPRWR